MKTRLLILMLLLINTIASAQTFEFSYDDSGNRYRRQVISLKTIESNEVETVAESNTNAVEDDSEPEIFTDIAGDHTVSIYPNPTKGQLAVKISGGEISSGSVSVFDLSGKEVYAKNKLAASEKIDLSNQSNGAYIMKIVVNEDLSEWKIVKE